MARPGALGLVLGTAAAAALAAALAPPIPQDPAYHRMADERALWGMPNVLNVASNAPFVVVGALGVWILLGRGAGQGTVHFIGARERWPYLVFFVGLLLTGVGSAYYHLEPGDPRLLWDRLPLALTLMGLFAAMIVERISVSAGLLLLVPLVALGIGSVLQWYAGEFRGAGDLRLYALVQFYPMVAIPLMLLLFAPRYTGGRGLLVALGLYGLAKLLELLDATIYSLSGVVSGHTLKHLAAALAGYGILRMLLTRQPA